MKPRGFGWLDVVKNVILAVVGKDGGQAYPPVPMCVICHRQNHWIVKGESYGCSVGHQFTIGRSIDVQQEDQSKPPDHNGGAI